MGNAYRGLPSRSGDTDAAARQLARELLRLLHHAGLVPNQLAAMPGVPYDVAQLNHFLSGEVLPPRHLIDLVTGLCGGDRHALHRIYDSAVRPSAPPADQVTVEPMPAPAPIPTAAPAPAPAPPTVPQPAVRPSLFRPADADADDTGASAPTGEEPREASPPRRRALANRMVVAALGCGAVAVVATLTVANAVTDLTGSPENRQQRARTNAADAVPKVATASTAASSSPADPDDEPIIKGPELVTNGDFVTSSEDWWASDKVRLRVSRQRLRVAVAPDSGSSHMDAMVMQTLPAMGLNKNYIFSFDGSAEGKTSITVSIQREMKKGAPTFVTERVTLTPKMRRYTFRFTTKQYLNPPILCFQVGGHPDGHVMWLDNVSVAEIG